MQAPGADIFRALVDVGGDERNFLDCVGGEFEMHAFRFEQGLVLSDQGVLRLGKDPHEVLFTQRAQFHADREPALELGN